LGAAGSSRLRRIKGWEEDRLVNVSDHFDGTRFCNPTGANGQPFSAVPRMLREPREPWPAKIPVGEVRPPSLGTAAAAVTFIGHSTFLVQTPAGHVITDPVYGMRAGPFARLGPRRVRRPAVAFDDLPRISTVLLSHNHYDHCDLRTLRALRDRFRPHVIAPVGNARLLRSAGIRDVEELDWWDVSASSSISVVLTPAQHFSARTPFDRNRALWGGFVLSTGEARIFFAGDSGYAEHFRDVRARCGPIDLALLPIGAYEPRWFMKDMHMNPAEAVQAHQDLESPRSVAMHFGTFQLTTEGIEEPLRALDAALDARGIPRASFRALEFGGSTTIGGRPQD
jgi:L-ascorbate metabolism protein UlaG (beta-lactamase superfamily)